MTPRVYFEPEPAWVDHVAFVFAPFDSFTGLPVRGIDARLAGRSASPVVKPSGQLVFLNLPDGDYQAILSDPRKRYFDPEPLALSLSSESDKLFVVPLVRRPGFDFEQGTTVVVGVVRRGGQGVEGATVQANVADASSFGAGTRGRPFATRTDRRGAFTLPLRLPSAEGSQGLALRFEFRANGRLHERALQVTPGRVNGFDTPVELEDRE